MHITRLAPSPTGALHLGNARTFLINWLLARQNEWNIVLRIEDLDGPRIKKGADREAIDDLKWLGLDWDEGPIYQSPRRAVYQAAVQKLLRAGNAYPCVCSRREVELAASAPHVEDGAAIYPGTCRDRFSSVEEARQQLGREPAIRFRVPLGNIEFVDQFKGTIQCNIEQELGDFVIAKADGTAAYQLAVVVDDAEMNITDIVRGDDLVDSTPRQILLYRVLGLSARIPLWWHLPLVIGADGRRLAKRHGDTRLATYRQAGVSAGEVLTLLAAWSGVKVSQTPNTAGDLLDYFDISRVPNDPIVFDPSSDAPGPIQSRRQ